MAEHTPGPWIVKHAGNQDEIWADRGLVAELNLYLHGSTVTGANARLIAAAPELLELIEYVRNHAYLVDLSEETIRNIDTVIAKIKGGTTQ